MALLWFVQGLRSYVLQVQPAADSKKQVLNSATFPSDSQPYYRPKDWETDALHQSTCEAGDNQDRKSHFEASETDVMQPQ